MPKMGAVKRLTLRISNGRHLRYLTGITIEFQITLRKYVRSNRSLAGKRHARLALWPHPSGIGAGDRQLNGPCRGPRGDPKIGSVVCIPAGKDNSRYGHDRPPPATVSFTYPEGIRWLAETCRTPSTPARASRPGAGAAHGPDAAADVKRFDEQLVQVEGARRIAGREHDDHHLPVPRTNQAGKAPSIGPDGGPHHTDRAAPVTRGSSHQGWATILPRPGCLDLGGQTEDRRLIAELRNDLHADRQPLRAPGAAAGSRPGGRMV